MSSPGGRRARARKVSAVTKRSAAGVTSGATSYPPFTSRRHTSQALYAAMPPLTPRRILAMTEVCLHLGQKLACGLEINVVHDDLRRAGHGVAAVCAAGGDVRPAVRAFDAVDAEQAAQCFGL